MLILYLWIARATPDPHAAASEPARARLLQFNGHAGGAVACGNDAGQAVVLEPLPSGLKAPHQRVSPHENGVRLGWHPPLSRAVAP